MRHALPIRAALGALLAALLLSSGAAALEQSLTQAETGLSTQGTLPAACAESPLGSLAADAARQACETDLAVLPAGLLTGTLEAGSVFESDLARIVPEDAPLQTVPVTPAQLKALLETGVSRLVTDEADRIDTERSAWAGFPQVSGFTWEYDVSAPVGERVQYIRIDGKALALDDDTTQYTLASSASLFDGSLGFDIRPAQETGYTLRSALAGYCSARETLTKPDARATAIGTSSYPIMGKFPIVAIAAACAIVALLASIPRTKQKKYFSFQQ